MKAEDFYSDFDNFSPAEKKQAEKSFEIAEELSDLVNNFSFDARFFCDAMATQHRTLQQNFTRLLMNWVEYCASDNYRFDGRNEGTKNLCKKLSDLHKKETGFNWCKLPDFLGHV